MTNPLPPLTTVPETITTARSQVMALGSVQELCTANPKRVALIISGNQSSTNISPSNANLGSVGASAVPGGILLVNSSPIILSRKLHGSLCTDQWFGIAPNVTDQVTVTESVEK